MGSGSRSDTSWTAAPGPAAAPRRAGARPRGRPGRASELRLGARAPPRSWQAPCSRLAWPSEEVPRLRCLGRAPRPRFDAALHSEAATGARLLSRALRVELQEARQHLVADFVGPPVAPGLLPVAPLLLVDLVVEEELAVGRDVAPAVGVENGAVHGGVQITELRDLRIGLVGVVKAVVGLGQALAVSDHESGAELVVALTGGFERRVSLPVLGQGEGLEAVGGGIAEVVLHRRRE